MSRELIGYSNAPYACLFLSWLLGGVRESYKGDEREKVEWELRTGLSKYSGGNEVLLGVSVGFKSAGIEHFRGAFSSLVCAMVSKNSTLAI